MFSRSHFLRLALISLFLAAATGSVRAADEPYEVTIWANVLFGTDGRSSEMQVVDEERHPAKFVAYVHSKLSAAQIQPPLDAGNPATLRTGVRVAFLVTPSASGGTVRVLGLTMQPLPTKTYYASYPADIAKTGGWKGSVTAICTVGVEGKCLNIDVHALPGMPESVRRYAKVSLENWTFMPQEVNGKPVEGDYKLSINFETLDSAPQDFRGSKFERAANSK